MLNTFFWLSAHFNLYFFFRYSALYHASKLGDSDIVSLLLSYGPDLSTPPAVTECTIRDPLQIACCHGHKNVAELLIKAGTDHMYV